MFSVIVVCTLLIFRRKPFYSVIIFLLGLSPIILYGLISISHNWLFVPNTILVKSKLPELSLLYIPKTIFRFIKNVTEPHILVLISSSVFLFLYSYIKKSLLWEKKQLFLLIFILTTIFHETFAQNGWFFRYEAYLVAIGITAFSLNISQYLPVDFSMSIFKEKFINKGINRFVLGVFAAPLFMWSLTAFIVPLATNNIYDQHYQMGQFVKNCTHHINIAANDIGIISFYSDNYVLDLWGLADIEVGKAKIGKNYTTDKISEITERRKIKLAILYEHWFDQYGGLPKNWVKIGEWTITDYNIVCGTETVSFYATQKDSAQLFRKELEQYSLQLPKSVKYKIFE